MQGRSESNDGCYKAKNHGSRRRMGLTQNVMIGTTKKTMNVMTMPLLPTHTPGLDDTREENMKRAKQIEAIMMMVTINQTARSILAAFERC